MKYTLKVWRTIKGLSQAQLAEKIGVSQVTLSKWENGKGSPTYKHLRAVANVLEIGIDDIIMP